MGFVIPFDKIVVRLSETNVYRCVARGEDLPLW